MGSGCRLVFIEEICMQICVINASNPQANCQNMQHHMKKIPKIISYFINTLLLNIFKAQKERSTSTEVTGQYLSLGISVTWRPLWAISRSKLGKPTIFKHIEQFSDVELVTMRINSYS